jgi:hypothetical protein
MSAFDFEDRIIDCALRDALAGERSDEIGARILQNVLEAAIASLRERINALAEQRAHESRLLNAQQHANEPAAAPVPPQPPIATGVPAYADGPPVGYDSPPGFSQAPSAPRYEPIPEQSGRDESYAKPAAGPHRSR